MNRQEIVEVPRPYQQQQLQKLLQYVWQSSSFYQEYYRSHGIREKDLPELSIGDLPILSKRILMENFDRAVTDPRLKKIELEEWIQNNPDPRQQFGREFIVVHTSGSSGDIGIFVYDQRSWRMADVAMATHLPMPESYPTEGIRVAFYVAAHGHFAMVTIAASMQKPLYNTLILSPLDSRARIVDQLNAFQPHRLCGYSTTVAELAELTIQGTLDIHPQRILVAGDKLTSSLEAKIRKAWHAPIQVTYGASESKYIAVREGAQHELTVLDELNIVEVLDNSDRSVPSGGEGRVVLTNLYNYVLPIIRYEFDDNVIVGATHSNAGVATIRDIKGRANDPLPVMLQDGRNDTIHPIILSEFHVPRLEKIQFISRLPGYISLNYIAPVEMDAAIRNQFQKLLSSKNATQTTFEVRRVDHIGNDPNTGKHRLVVVQTEQERSRSAISSPGLEKKPLTTPAKPAADEKLPDALYKLLLNHAGQYSIWPAGEPSPGGWRDSGWQGTKTDSRLRVRETCPDMKLSSQSPLKHQSIQALFEEQVQRTPSSTAVVSGAQALTYYELNARANQLAHHLRGLGVEAGTLVAICVRRSLDMAVGILGILKAGGAWLPLDPLHPRARQERMLQDARVPVVVTQEALVAGLAANSAQTVLIDSHWDSISQCSASDLPGISSSEDLAYVMYTSGSTGQPKGAMITHGNVCHYVRAMREPLAVGDKDVYLHTATIAFSSSVRQLMVPLTHGATVVIATAEEVGQPLSLFEVIKEKRVTILDVVPSYWRACIDILTSLDAPVRTRLLDNRLRLILTASEPLLSDLPRKWKLGIGRSTQLVNMFGQTETTGIVTTYAIPQNDHSQIKTVPIGEPIGDTEIYLLDEHQDLVPIGTMGELYIGGPGLGQGYLNDPKSTAERFVPNFFSNQAGDRLYKTGDMARYQTDGSLEFMGRVDDQVKIRGVRVELGEVEAVLATHPGIKETVVVARERGDQDEKRLFAYFVPKAGNVTSASDLRTFLDKQLPTHMIPSVFVVLDTLPRLANGKLDRRALPEPDHSRSGLEGIVVKARNTLELQLVAIWQAALNIVPIGVTDNFFDLGGNSLAILFMLSRIEKTFGRKLSPAALFQAPTVEELEKLLQGEEPPVSWSSLVPLHTQGSRPPFFWIHGEFSDAFLPRYLGPDQPVYALVHQSGDGKPARFKTVETIAAHYLSEMRTVQPEGPYYLGGYCFGGLVAFEIAQQLKKQHQEVAFLALLEPNILRTCGTTPLLPITPAKSSPIRHRWVGELHNIARLAPGRRLRYIWQKSHDKITDLSRRMTTPGAPVLLMGQITVSKICLWLGRDLPYSLRSPYILRVYGRATRNYTLRPYPGSMALFVVRESSDGSPSSWEGVAMGETRVYEVPGGHTNVLRQPYMQVWAEKLAIALAAITPTAEVGMAKSSR